MLGSQGMHRISSAEAKSRAKEYPEYEELSPCCSRRPSPSSKHPCIGFWTRCRAGSKIARRRVVYASLVVCQWTLDLLRVCQDAHRPNTWELWMFQAAVLAEVQAVIGSEMVHWRHRETERPGGRSTKAPTSPTFNRRAPLQTGLDLIHTPTAGDKIVVWSWISS